MDNEEFSKLFAQALQVVGLGGFMVVFFIVCLSWISRGCSSVCSYKPIAWPPEEPMPPGTTCRVVGGPHRGKRVVICGLDEDLPGFYLASFVCTEKLDKINFLQKNHNAYIRDEMLEPDGVNAGSLDAEVGVSETSCPHQLVATGVQS